MTLFIYRLISLANRVDNSGQQTTLKGFFVVVKNEKSLFLKEYVYLWNMFKQRCVSKD